MSLGKKRSAIVKLSGGEIWLKEVKSDGTDLQVPGAWFSPGYIQESELKDEFKESKVPDETGSIVRILHDSREVSIVGIFEQSDKDLLDFLRKGCVDKYYRVYHYQGIVDDKHQELFFGICQLTPGVSLKSGTKRPPFTINVLKNDTAITVATADMPAIKKATAEVAIDANEFYDIAETAVT